MMQQIEDSPLGNKILQIISNKNSGITYVSHEIIIHTNLLDIPVDMVESVENLADYNGNVADYRLATFLVQMGDYVKDIHPFRDNLEITIIKNLHENMIIKNRYKFVIINNTADINGSRYTSSSREDLNKQEQARVVGQCIDRVVEVMRMQNVSGMFPAASVEKVIKVNILDNINKITVNGIKPQMNVTMTTANNQSVYNNIAIPTGVNILDLPTYIQNITYGVYNGHIGTYVTDVEDITYKDTITPNGNTSSNNSITTNSASSDDDFTYADAPSNDINANDVTRTTTTSFNNATPSNYNVYIYPLYNSLLFDQANKKLVIYATNSMKFELVEHTYLVNGDLVEILAGASTRSIDTGENEYMDGGVGYTALDVGKVLNRPLNISKDGATVNTNIVNIAKTIKDRKDGGNKTVFLPTGSNTFLARSDVLKSTMMLYQVHWNYCNVDLIYPGMPVMYTYLDDDNGIVKLKGVVQSFYYMYNEGTNTVNGIINIMVEKPYIDPKKTITNPETLLGRMGL